MKKRKSEKMNVKKKNWENGYKEKKIWGKRIKKTKHEKEEYEEKKSWEKWVKKMKYEKKKFGKKVKYETEQRAEI